MKVRVPPLSADINRDALLVPNLIRYIVRHRRTMSPRKMAELIAWCGKLQSGAPSTMVSLLGTLYNTDEAAPSWHNLVIPQPAHSMLYRHQLNLVSHLLESEDAAISRTISAQAINGENVLLIAHTECCANVDLAAVAAGRAHVRYPVAVVLHSFVSPRAASMSELVVEDERTLYRTPRLAASVVPDGQDDLTATLIGVTNEPQARLFTLSHEDRRSNIHVYFFEVLNAMEFETVTTESGLVIEERRAPMTASRLQRPVSMECFDEQQQTTGVAQWSEQQQQQQPPRRHYEEAASYDGEDDDGMCGRTHGWLSSQHHVTHTPFASLSPAFAPATNSAAAPMAQTWPTNGDTGVGLTTEMPPELDSMHQQNIQNAVPIDQDSTAAFDRDLFENNWLPSAELERHAWCTTYPKQQTGLLAQQPITQTALSSCPYISPDPVYRLLPPAQNASVSRAVQDALPPPLNHQPAAAAQIEPLSQQSSLSRSGSYAQSPLDFNGQPSATSQCVSSADPRHADDPFAGQCACGQHAGCAGVQHAGCAGVQHAGCAGGQPAGCAGATQPMVQHQYQNQDPMMDYDGRVPTASIAHPDPPIAGEVALLSGNQEEQQRRQQQQHQQLVAQSFGCHAGQASVGASSSVGHYRHDASQPFYDNHTTAPMDQGHAEPLPAPQNSDVCMIFANDSPTGDVVPAAVAPDSSRPIGGSSHWPAAAGRGVTSAGALRTTTTTTTTRTTTMDSAAAVQGGNTVLSRIRQVVAPTYNPRGLNTADPPVYDRVVAAMREMYNRVRTKYQFLRLSAPYLRTVTHLQEPYSSGKTVSVLAMCLTDPRTCNVIVVRSLLLNHWHHTQQRFFPRATVLTITTRSRMVHVLNNWPVFNHYQIVLVCQSVFRCTTTAQGSGTGPRGTVGQVGHAITPGVRIFAHNDMANYDDNYHYHPLHSYPSSSEGGGGSGSGTDPQEVPGDQSRSSRNQHQYLVRTPLAYRLIYDDPNYVRVSPEIDAFFTYVLSPAPLSTKVVNSMVRTGHSCSYCDRRARHSQMQVVRTEAAFIDPRCTVDVPPIYDFELMQIDRNGAEFVMLYSRSASNGGGGGSGVSPDTGEPADGAATTSRRHFCTLPPRVYLRQQCPSWPMNAAVIKRILQSERGKISRCERRIEELNGRRAHDAHTRDVIEAIRGRVEEYRGNEKLLTEKILGGWCSVCMSNTTEYYVPMCCRNPVCVSCSERVMACPLCRSKTFNLDAYRFSELPLQNHWSLKTSTLQRRLLLALSQWEEHASANRSANVPYMRVLVYVHNLTLYQELQVIDLPPSFRMIRISNTTVSNEFAPSKFAKVRGHTLSVVERSLSLYGLDLSFFTHAFILCNDYSTVLWHKLLSALQRPGRRVPLRVTQLLYDCDIPEGESVPHLAHFYAAWRSTVIPSAAAAATTTTQTACAKQRQRLPSVVASAASSSSGAATTVRLDSGPATQGAVAGAAVAVSARQQQQPIFGTAVDARAAPERASTATAADPPTAAASAPIGPERQSCVDWTYEFADSSSSPSISLSTMSSMSSSSVSTPGSECHQSSPLDAALASLRECTNARRC